MIITEKQPQKNDSSGAACIFLLFYFILFTAVCLPFIRANQQLYEPFIQANQPPAIAVRAVWQHEIQSVQYRDLSKYAMLVKGCFQCTCAASMDPGNRNIVLFGLL